VGARHHRHLSRRLLRHPDGRAGYEFPVQYHGRTDVLRVCDEFSGDGALLWEARWGGANGAGVGGVYGCIEV